MYEKALKTGEVTKYYSLGGRRVAMSKGGTLSYLASDHLGGTSLVMNASGAVTSRMRYHPYGQAWTQSAAPATDKLFTGHTRLGARSGMYYAGARFYSADLGRFMSADSIVPDAGSPAAYNRYAYVVNNPANYVDPSGHSFLRSLRVPPPPGDCQLAAYLDPAPDPSPAPGRVYVSWSVGAFNCPGERYLFVMAALYKWTIGTPLYKSLPLFLLNTNFKLCVYVNQCYTRPAQRYILAPAFVVISACASLSTHLPLQCAGLLFMVSATKPPTIQKVGAPFKMY